MICDKIHSLGQIVIPTATAAFAAQLYPGGCTTHSVFKVSPWFPLYHHTRIKYFIHFYVPVNDKNEMLQSPIKPIDPQGKLIKEASIIIWDEGPMVNQAVLACVKEVCHTVMNNDQPFGGKIVVVLGENHQTCPVICGGT